VKSGIEKGVDAVEIDVNLTKDDVLVLSHDPNLKRMTGKDINIGDVTYDDIKDIDVGKVFDEAYAGETIATLDEILEITDASNTRVIIDVKTDVNEDIYASEIARLI